MHQTSGSTKNRLSEEISPFLLPVLISGPNETGLPLGSQLLIGFCEFLQKLHGRKYHITVILALVDAFMNRTMFYGTLKKLDNLSIKVAFTRDVAEKCYQ